MNLELGADEGDELKEDELELIRVIGAEEVRGLAVTYRQLQLLTARKSNYSVQLLAKKLAARGYVALNPGCARAIRLTRLGWKVATQGVGARHVLPILGVRRSFHAAKVDQGTAKYFALSGGVFEPAADYLIVAAGAATFPERGIFDGDLVAIRQTAEAQHQQLFLEEFQDELRLGKALPRGGEWKLVGSEDGWVSITPRILGEVVGVLRTRVTSRKRCRQKAGSNG